MTRKGLARRSTRSTRWALLGSLLLTCISIPAGAAPPAKEGDREKADLLVVAGWVVSLDPEDRIYTPGAVAISGTEITAVGPSEEILSRFESDRIVDEPESILLPGLINGHTHASMVHLRSLGDELSLEDWLTQKVFPAEKIGVTKEAVRWGTRLALAEMIRGGITTYCDMYYFEEIVAEETKRAGMRGILGQTVIGFPVPDAQTPEAELARTEAFIQKFRHDPLITPAVAPHSTYTVSAEILRRCRELADRYRVPLLTHMSETQTEVADVRGKTGMTPIAYAESLGLLSGWSLLAHVVHPTAAELSILTRRGVGIAHCPQSNMKLGSGIAPVPQLLKMGIPLSLGTDGPASNDDLNLWEEIDTACKLQKVAHLDPLAMSAKTSIRMATRLGAQAIGLGDRIGSLEVGKQADLILVGRGRAGTTPLGEIWDHLAYVTKASDVRTVIVAGKILLRDGDLLTIDEGEAMTWCSEWREKIEQTMKAAENLESDR